MTNNRASVLVTAASGKTGRRVADRLRAGGHDVRAGSRTATGPGTVRFDWTDTSTWAPSLDGVETAYLAFVPDLSVPGALGTVEQFTTLAAGQGVRRIVLLSGRGEPEAQRAEDAVFAAADRGGAAATVVRCAWFAQNFSEAFLRDAVLEGAIVLPSGDAVEPFVDADDIADVAVAALTDPTGRHAGRVHELTGPRALGFAEVADLISDASGHAVRYQPVPVEAYLSGLRAAGLPEEEVALYAYLLTELLDGRNAHVTDGVLQALGRPARPFEDYVKTAAAAGAWTVQGAR